MTAPRILIISSGEDSGGVGIAIKRAFDRHSDWDVRQVRMNNNYLDYPCDIELNADNLAEVDDLFEKADVVHMMERWWGPRRYASFFNKPKIMHHHGTIFRTDPTPLMEQAELYRAISVVSTIDLLMCAPPDELRWVPNPVYIEKMEQISRAHRVGHEGVLVVHAPTGREKKGTARWLQAFEGLPADLRLIEGVTWEECLRQKSEADLLMDQLRVGYGNNALEAWAMGIGVISGVEDQNVADLMQQTIGYLPFYRTTAATLNDRLKEIVEDADLRWEYAKIGNDYVKHFHDERKVVGEWQDIYREAMERG